MFYALGDLRPRVHETAFVAPNAMIIGDVEIRANASIWFGAVLRGDQGPIVIGEGTNVQDGAVIHKGTTIGRNCTIAHLALVHETVVEDNVLIGNGALVYGGTHIGSGSIVGAGAVITGGDVAPGSLMLGVPARKAPATVDLDAVIAKGVTDYETFRALYQGQPGMQPVVEVERFR
jgi:carbonic anhydrase/acetyltransferase-like protein (isoleucine patch superfamily)